MHDGHRERLRNKIRKSGFECLEDHEKLEYLLFSFIPRRDTNAIAHALIDTFGSYKKVLNAEVALLAQVKGMTENAALFLHLLPEAFSAYLVPEKDAQLTNTLPCAELISARIGRMREEHYIVLYLDDACRLIKTDVRTSDERKKVLLNRDALVANAVQCRARYVVLGHNHPHGALLPSEQDIEATNRIAQALGLVGIKLGDHIIVSEYDYYSMKEHGEIVEAVSLNGSFTHFAENLIRRENDVAEIKRLRVPCAKRDR